MIFQIRWRQAAIDDLTNAWLRAGSQQRAAISAATHFVERELKVLPHQKGESRSEGERIFFRAPMGVVFEIDEQDRSVIINVAWIFRTH